jgi:hypothetical protein
MTGRDLKAVRIKLVGDGRGSVKLMANKLETAYRTYQDWEAKIGSIPGVAAVAVRSLEKLAEIARQEA